MTQSIHYDLRLRLHLRLPVAVAVAVAVQVLLVVLMTPTLTSAFGVSPMYRYGVQHRAQASVQASSRLYSEQDTAACGSSPFNSTFPAFPNFLADMEDMWSSTEESTISHGISIGELEAVEFVSARDLEKPASTYEDDDGYNALYPFAGMLRNSARYIADHSKRTAVFNIPGDILDTPKVFSRLMGDIALSWMLGLKIVLVVGCRFDVDCCNLGFDHSHECHNSLRNMDDALMRKVEEEAGFVRFEVERTLNRHLRLHGGMSMSSTCTMRDDAPALNGNVVGGTFYTARPFGVVNEEEFKNTGYPTKVYTERIEQSLENNDIVLLSTVGMTRMGDCVYVNGQHLAATVAAALQANKLVYLSQNDAVLKKRNSDDDKTMQEVPLKFAQALLQHYHMRVNPAGLAYFPPSHLKPDATELMLYLAWSSWALEQGVNRAHIVNPYSDGSLLEELFSSKEGLNTCLYHEDEAEDLDLDEDNSLEFDY
jgi:acetylglutamate kinase